MFFSVNIFLLVKRILIKRMFYSIILYKYRYIEYDFGNELFDEELLFVQWSLD